MPINTRLLILLLFINNGSFGQKITYPDSCLSLGFYFQNKDLKINTVKTIKLKTAEIQYFFSANRDLLNLVVLFKNNCNQYIAIPSEIRLDMPGQDDFSIEGFRINGGKSDTLQFDMEYDYLHRSTKDSILKPNKVNFQEFEFSLGFSVNKGGTFKFRLRFFNEHNYIPIKEWKYYYSNWIYLTINEQ